MGLKDDAAETPVAYGPNPGRDHPDILSDVVALHGAACAPLRAATSQVWAEADRLQAERFEMARRVGFAKAEIREAIQYLVDGEGTYWIEKSCRRAISMLETGKAG